LTRQAPSYLNERSCRGLQQQLAGLAQVILHIHLSKQCLCRRNVQSRTIKQYVKTVGLLPPSHRSTVPRPKRICMLYFVAGQVFKRLPVVNMCVCVCVRACVLRGRQRVWLPVGRGQLMHFSGNLTVVIERTRVLHGNEQAHPRSVFFTSTVFCLRCIFWFLWLIIIHGRCKKSFFVFIFTLVMQLAFKTRWLQLFIHPFFSPRSRVQTPKEDHPPHSLPKWLQ
jgi:hypothetical protein